MVAIRAMTKQQLKSYVVGELAAIANGSATRAAGKRSFTFNYTILGKLVCREVFLEVHGMSTKVLATLQKVEERGTLSPRHKNPGKIPPNSTYSKTCAKVADFIQNYAADHGLPQPAAPKRRPHQAPTYLPASCTKSGLFEYSGIEGTKTVL